MSDCSPFLTGKPDRHPPRPLGRWKSPRVPAIVAANITTVGLGEKRPRSGATRHDFHRRNEMKVSELGRPNFLPPVRSTCFYATQRCMGAAVGPGVRPTRRLNGCGKNSRERDKEGQKVHATLYKITSNLYNDSNAVNGRHLCLNDRKAGLSQDVYATGSRALRRGATV